MLNFSEMKEVIVKEVIVMVMKVLDMQAKEQNECMKNGAASPVAFNLPEPGPQVESKQAIERVFRKNSELFRRLAQ